MTAPVSAAIKRLQVMGYAGPAERRNCKGCKNSSVRIWGTTKAVLYCDKATAAVAAFGICDEYISSKAP